jgi:hypothetical protein
LTPVQITLLIVIPAAAVCAVIGVTVLRKRAKRSPNSLKGKGKKPASKQSTGAKTSKGVKKAKKVDT